MHNSKGGACRPQAGLGLNAKPGGAKIPRSLRGAVLACATIASAIPGLVQAAEAAAPANEIEGVTVSGRRAEANPYADPVAPYKIDRLASAKFTEDLLNVPKSIIVIPKEVIADTGAFTFRDLMRTQPGVTLGTGEGGNAFGDRFFIRGFDTRNDIYIDGVRDPGVGSREVFAVEQVEVLKGPSSTFGGRGTTGGAISLVSKQPAQKDFINVTGVLGTDETHRATIDLNHAVSDTLTFRINAMYHESDVARRDYVFNNRWGVSAAIKYAPTDKLTLTADYYHLNTDELPDWGVSYNLPANKPLVFDRDLWYGVLQRDYRDTWADIYTAKAVYDISDNVRVQTIGRYGQTLNAYVASAPETPVLTDPNPLLWTLRANPKQRDAVTTYWANQSDLTWKFDALGWGHTVVVGYEIDNEKVRNRQYANLASELGGGVVVQPTTITQLVSAPNPFAPWPFPKSLSAIRTTEVDSKSLYVVDTLKLNDQWQIMGGLRFDRYDITLRTFTPATAARTSVSNSSDFVNGTLGIVYKPAVNASIYASFGTSSNPSGEQLDAAAADYGGLVATNAALEAEKNRAYELGVKWNVLDEHLNLAAALFRIDKINARVTTGAGATATISLSGDQRVDGFELTANGNITPQWSVFGGVTHLDAKTIGSPVASQVGLAFPNIAKTGFTMLSRYQATEHLYVGGSANYSSAKYGGTVVVGNTFVPSYWRFDLFAGYRFNEKVAVSANVLNVGDKLYFDALYRSASPFTYIAPGRSALIKLDYSF
jgi:catecholate siderophore receptor